MKKKISIYDKIKVKTALLKSKSFFLASITFIGLISVFIPFSEFYKKLVGTNIYLEIFYLVIIFIVVYIFLFFSFYFILFFYKKYKIKKIKAKIIIFKNNIFDKYSFNENKVLLIPVDKDFTINFDEYGKIDEKTIHGQFLKKFQTSIVKVDKQADGFIKQFYYEKDGKKLTAFFMPLSYINPPDYKATIKSMDEFLIDCKKTIEYINGNLNGRELIMPIIGSGKSRINEKSIFFDDINNTLSFWIMYFKMFGDKYLKVTITVLPEQWNLIDFYQH